MTDQERFREAIEQEYLRLGAMIPTDRRAAILALIRAQDRLTAPPAPERAPDLITGRRIVNLGGSKALALCLELTGGESGAGGLGRGDLEGWAEGFLLACARIAEAETVLMHVETGFMRLIVDGEGRCCAWVATKRPPAMWRERADIDWWASWLARLHAARPGVSASPETRSTMHSAADRHAGRRAGAHLDRMAYQIGYPPDAVLGGCTVQTYRDVVGWLIARALAARDAGQEVVTWPEDGLAGALAAALEIEGDQASRALAALTLDRDNAAYHAAVPGIAAAPLVRTGPAELAWSLHGLTTEPFFFLLRELKRREAQEYHNRAYLREAVFRQDLYALFADKRFVTSSGRIALRRDDGDVRTDIDAAVFDRKTGTLGLFELKSQDPFARSAAELARQRDTVLYANRQVAGILAWLKRYGADEVLNRIDPRVAKTFRVQKVYPFVLGRYLAHFSDGPPPDPRAAWGTWPQVLRLLDGEAFRGNAGNPIGSLFARLAKDAPAATPLSDASPREIALGTMRVIVYPSYAAFQSRAKTSSIGLDP